MTVSVMLVHIVTAALVIRIAATTNNAVCTPTGHVIPRRCLSFSPTSESEDDLKGCHGVHPIPVFASVMRCACEFVDDSGTGCEENIEDWPGVVAAVLGGVWSGNGHPEDGVSLFVESVRLTTSESAWTCLSSIVSNPEGF